MKITVCIGSSCHLKGSRNVVEELQRLIHKNELEDKIDLAGTFCMGNCQKGVCVTIEDAMFSILPETVTSFFETEIITRIL